MFAKQLRLFVLITLLTFMISLLQAAPQGKIEGYVFDSQTNEPLQGANVLLAGTTYGAATDLKGKFVIPVVPIGDYKLVIRYMGYNEKSVDISIKEAETLKEIITLDFQVIEGEVIAVTAQAEGQMQAINQQLASNTIANIVSKDRIRELPDVNAAESIGRLPGVAIRRSGGEATQIAIRGLSPKYNTVTVNGVRVPSTSAEDRSVDLSLISSNMLDGIEVRKANTPDMDADVIGGTVDLKLRDAPERFQYDVSIQGGYNQLQDYYGNYKFNGNVSNRFYDNRLGVIASVNVDNYNRSADKLDGNYRISESTINIGTTVNIPTELRLREENLQRSRAGGSLVLDYRLPNGKITSNSFYNQLKSDNLIHINDINTNIGRYYYDLESRNSTTSIFTGSIGAEQDFNWIKYDFGIARTASRTKNPEDFRWRFGKEGDIYDPDKYVLIDENTRLWDIQGMLRIDSTIALHNIWVDKTKREENTTLVQMNVQIPFLISKQVSGYFKTGGKFRWLDRMNDQQQTGRAGLQYGSGAGNLNEPFEWIAAQLPSWNLDEIIGDQGWLPINLVLTDYKRDDFLKGDYDLGFVYDEEKMKQLTRALQSNPDQYRNNAVGSRGRDYDGIERYQAAYFMAELNIGRYVTLSPGIRWEGDYSKYHGQRYREIISAWEDEAPGDLDTLTSIRTNDYWLPMIHLKVKPYEWLQIRLAQTKTLTRPDYIQYAPITSIDGFRSTVNAANSQLKPFQSTNSDVAISVYQSHVGLFTISGFYKSIEDLIIPVNFILHPDITSLLPDGLNVPITWYSTDRPRLYTNINSPFEAIYKGFEIDWQANFWYLPYVFRGLMLSANYTYINSKTRYQGFYLVNSDSIRTNRPRTYYQTLKTDSSRAGRMLNQPGHIANLTIGYDYKGFSIRFSFLYQTDISTNIDGNDPLLDNFSGEYTRFDIAVKQKFTNHIEFFANFNNINNRPDENFRQKVGALPTYIEYYGFTMDLGVRVKF